MLRLLARTLWPSFILSLVSSTSAAADSPDIATAPQESPKPAANTELPDRPPAPHETVPPVVESSVPEKPAEKSSIEEPAANPNQLPRLHIETNRPGVRLMRIERAISDDMGEGILVNTVCSAPCDQFVDGRKRQTFFFGADGMVPSRGFRLARLHGDIVANVQGGSLIARQVGFLIGGFGGAAILGGATMLGIGYANDGAHLSSAGKIVDGPNTTLTTGGFITLGVGAAMVTTAVVLVLTAKTKITFVQANEKSAGVSLEMGTLRF